MKKKILRKESWLDEQIRKRYSSKKMFYVIVKILILLAESYVVLGLVVYFLQDMVLYQPGNYSRADLVGWSKRYNLVLWPDQKFYWCLVSEENPVTKRPTVIIFHGNAGAAMDRHSYLRQIESLGYRVLLYEYPGYGSRAGKTSQRKIVEDAVLTVVTARQQFGGPIYLIGESLGAGVAAAVVREVPEKVDAVLLVTPWDNLLSLFQARFWYLPNRIILKDRYDSVDNLKNYTKPIGIVMVKQDNVIPNSSTLRLNNAVRKNSMLWIIPHVDHNTWLLTFDTQSWRRVFLFLESKSFPDQTRTVE